MIFSNLCANTISICSIIQWHIIALAMSCSHQTIKHHFYTNKTAHNSSHNKMALAEKDLADFFPAYNCSKMGVKSECHVSSCG